MNLGVLGSLLVEVSMEGADEARKEMEGMQTSTKKAGDESRKQVPTLEKMGKRWSSMLTLVAASGAVAFGIIAKSSPSVLASLIGIQIAFESIFMIIGDELAPVFEWFEGLLWKVYDWFESLSPTTKTFIAALVGGVIVVGALAAALLAVIVIGPTLTAAAGTIASVVGISFGWILVIVAAVVIAVALLYTAWKNNLWGIQDKVHAAVEWIKYKWANLMYIIHDENKTTWEKVKAIFWLAYDSVKEILGKMKTWMIDKFTDIYDETVIAWDNVKNYIKDSILEAYNFVIDKLGGVGTFIDNTVGKVKGIFSGSSGSSRGGKDKTQYDSSGRVSLRQSVSGTRALGGSVLTGASYLVGENGPELFTPNLSGKVSTAGKTKQIASQASKAASNMNLKIDVNLDGRKIWESMRKYSASELRRLGA